MTTPAADRSPANVAEQLARHATDTPDQQALVLVDEAGEVERVVTYAHLHRMVSAVAGGLRARGVRRGDAVVVFVPLSLELYVVLPAVLRLGATATFIDPWMGREGIEHAARLVDASAFVGVPKSLLLLLRSRTLRDTDLVVHTGRRPIPRTHRLRTLLETPEARHVTAAEQMAPDDHALVTFTGGSTGLPKGADRTHAFLDAQHRALEAEVPGLEGQRCYTNLPIVVLHALGRGATAVLPPASISQDPRPDPKRLHHLVERSGAAVLALSPEPLRQLTRAPGRAPLDEVRRCYTGGGPVLPDLLDAARTRMPQAEIVALYGSTEAEPIAHASAEQVLERRGAMRRRGGIFVGWPVDRVDVKVVRAVDHPIELEPEQLLADWEVAPGAPGEVLVAGDHVNRSYLHDPEAVRENKVVDEDGRTWHRTGDVARTDEDGGLWLLGRRGHGFNVDGRRRWALEIETPVVDLPEVERAAVASPRFTGAGREFKNAVAVLAVQPAAGYSRREACHAAVRRLERTGFAASIEVRALDEVPMDRRHASKVDVERLVELLDPHVQDDY